MAIVNIIPRRDPPTIVVPIPTVTIDEYEYDGTTKAPTIVRDTDNTIITGTPSATEVGTYTFTISLKDTNKMIWDWDGQGYSTAPKSYEWEIKANPHIWGAKWSGSYNSLSRTDAATDFVDPVPYYSGMSGTPSSPFDNISPWKDIVRVTDSTLGELVKIPKFWYKWTISGDTLKIQIADYAVTGFSVSPAHADRGDGQGERDYVYVGRYHCNSSYKSVTNTTPAYIMKRSTARTSIKAKKTGAYQYDYAMYWTICMLYLVEYANWYAQYKIGYGCGDGKNRGNTGYTDSMPYHTGTTQTSRTTYGLGTQYRYIEGLWDNVYDWCDGIYFSGTNVYIINNPNNFSDTSGGTNTNYSRPTSSGFIKSWAIPGSSGIKWALFPKTVNTNGIGNAINGQYNGYLGTNLFTGGSYNNKSTNSSGLFYLNTNLNDNQTSNTNIGARLMYLPPNS